MSAPSEASKHATTAFTLLFAARIVKNYLPAGIYDQILKDLSPFLKRDASPGAVAYAIFLGTRFESYFWVADELCGKEEEDRESGGDLPVLMGVRQLIRRASLKYEQADARRVGASSPTWGLGGGDGARDA